MDLDDVWCDNGFHSRLSVSLGQATTLAIINTCMVPFTVVLNILLFVSLLKTNQHRSVSNRYMCVLSVSDACIGAVVQVIVTLLFTVYRDRSVCRFETAATFLTFFFGHFSGYLVVSIAIDRAIHMKYLYTYSSIVTKRRGKIVIGICWSIAILSAVTYVVSGWFKVYDYANAAILIGDALAVSIIFITYWTVYCQVKAHVDQSCHLRAKVSLSQEVLHTSKREKKPKYALAMAKTIFYILAAVFVSYIPYVVTSLCRSYVAGIEGRAPSGNLEFSMYLTYLLVYLNSSLNAIIFLFGNIKCRNWLLKPLTDRGILSEAKKSETGTPEHTASVV